MDGVGYDNNFRDIINWACLIETASDSKKFSFCTCYEGSVMNCFDNWSIEWMYMQDRCCNIILDASIGDYEGREGIRRATKNHFVKFLTPKFVLIFFSFIN